MKATKTISHLLLTSILAMAFNFQQVQAAGIVGWGRNHSGEISVPDGNDFVAIAAGQLRSLALKADGSLVGWGIDQGDLPAGNDFAAITSGRFHSLALRSDGSLVGWGGRNDFGEVNVPPGNDFKGIAAGEYYSLALRKNGTLVSWGQAPTGLPTGNNFVAISGGYFHCLALKSDNSIIGWGNNIRGQTDVPPGNDFVAIAAGSSHSLALKYDGSIMGWGYDVYGQATPPPGNDFVAVAAGQYHSLALKSDGSLVGWGLNYYDQTDVPSGNDFLAIAAGKEHSLALVTTPRKLMVMYPNGGENLIGGKTHTIRWLSQGTINHVNIEYSSSNGLAWKELEPSVNNTGSYDWLVPQESWDHCLVRISDANHPNIFDTSDDMFAIYECWRPISADLSDNCYADWVDLGIFANQWLTSGCGEPDWCNGADLDQSEEVELVDFSIFATEWLDCSNPFDPVCPSPPQPPWQECWDCPTQCHGDADCQLQGGGPMGYYRVGTYDFAILMAAWETRYPEPDYDPCADFDRDGDVDDDDVAILETWWLVREPPQGPGVPANCPPEQPPPDCWDWMCQCHGDVDGNMYVDSIDLEAVIAAFQTSSSDTNYNRCADFNRDERVTMYDLLEVMYWWLQYPPSDCWPGLGSIFELWPGCWYSSTQCHGDANWDGIVDQYDLNVLESSLDTIWTDPGYIPCADFNRDGRVDGFDRAELDYWLVHNPPLSNCPTGPGFILYPSCYHYSFTQCHGDANGDGIVDQADKDMLLYEDEYGSVYWQPYNPCADFDRDGSLSMSDYNILQGNWGTNPPADCPPN